MRPTTALADPPGYYDQRGGGDEGDFRDPQRRQMMRQQLQDMPPDQRRERMQDMRHQFQERHDEGMNEREQKFRERWGQASPDQRQKFCANVGQRCNGRSNSPACSYARSTCAGGR